MSRLGSTTRTWAVAPVHWKPRLPRAAANRATFATCIRQSSSAGTDRTPPRDAADERDWPTVERPIWPHEAHRRCDLPQQTPAHSDLRFVHALSAVEQNHPADAGPQESDRTVEHQ